MSERASAAPKEGPPRALGWALIASAIVFWSGAVMPPYRQWTGVPLEEYLAIVAAHRANWLVMHALFAIATVLALASLAALASLLRASGDRIWGSVGSSLFTVASALWLLGVAFRVTVTVRTAASLHDATDIPIAYVASHELTGVLFAAFMLLAYLSMAAFGAALRTCDLLPSWVGRTALAFGVVAVPGLALPLFQPPLMVFVIPFVLGVSIVRGRAAPQRSSRAVPA